MQSTKRKKTQTNSKISQIKSSNRVDFPLLIIVLMLVALGLVMVLSASSPSALAESGDSYAYFKKQAIAIVIGFISMYFLSRLNYDIYKNFYKIIYYLSVLILFLVLVPHIGMDAVGRSKKMDKNRYANTTI